MAGALVLQSIAIDWSIGGFHDDENLSYLLDCVDDSECAGVFVKGNNFYPHEPEQHRLLTGFAHHTETRLEIMALRDMLNEALKNSAPLPDAPSI